MWIAQTRNWNIRIPSNTWTYNTTSSTTECNFICKQWFLRDYNNQSCNPIILPPECWRWLSQWWTNLCFWWN
jgi:hypothetical protein